MTFGKTMLPPEKQDLANELLDRVQVSASKARRNYWAAYFIAVLSVVASVVTAVSVAREWFPTITNAFLAAIPALAVASTAIFKFEERRDWWSRVNHGLDALRRGLLYEGRHESDVSKDMTAFLARLEKIRPRLGNLVTARQDDVTP